jgi:hypothetical protein
MPALDSAYTPPALFKLVNLYQCLQRDDELAREEGALLL